jgi:hypothetical protein
MPNYYKVFFYHGDRTEDLTLKTKAKKGRAWVDGQGLRIVSDSEIFLLPAHDIITVDMLRLHGLGRVVRIDHPRGRLFVSVVRLMIGQFAFIDWFTTRQTG